MDIGYVLFSPEGRIGRQDFWVGFLILFAAGVLLHLIPVLGTLVWMLSIYCWIVLYAKRLHDFNRTGWWSLIPILANVIGFAVIASFVLAIIFGVAAGSAYYGDGETAWWAVGPWLGGIFGIAAVLGALGLIHLIFLIWVGVSAGTPGPNRYGPPPVRPPAYPPAVQPPIPPASPEPPPGVVP